MLRQEVWNLKEYVLFNKQIPGRILDTNKSMLAKNLRLSHSAWRLYKSGNLDIIGLRNGFTETEKSSGWQIDFH